MQTQTNWKMPPEIVGLPFEDAVRAIIRHRQANPHISLQHGLSTDFEMVADELDNYTCLRLGGNPHYCSEEIVPHPRGGPTKKSVSPPSFLAGTKSVTAVAANTVAGIGLYLEWFGQGPVGKNTAARRLAVCLACKQNNTRLKLHEYFIPDVAKGLTKIMGMIYDMNLRLEGEDRAGICQACDCPVASKVWCPIGTVLGHIRAEAKAALDQSCWILSESQELSAENVEEAKSLGA